MKGCVYTYSMAHNVDNFEYHLVKFRWVMFVRRDVVGFEKSWLTPGRFGTSGRG